MAKPPATRVRLQKFLSDAGVASRRNAEELIEAGRVLVNDEVVVELPAFVDPRRDRVIVDGVVVHIQRPEYWIVHKPKGFVSATRDPQGRRRVLDLLPETAGRVLPVGRLDPESTGLLLLTSNGELAEQMAHPRCGLARVYHVEVKGRVPEGIVAQMRSGVFLAEGKARAARVELVHVANDASVLLVTLREERNRQVQRMLAKLGFPVRKLKRVEFGPLTLKGLPLGAARELSGREVGELRKAATEMAPERRGRGGRGPARHGKQPGSRRESAAAGSKREVRPAEERPTVQRRIIT